MRRVFQKSWLLLVLIFMYAPIVILAVYSFTDSTMIGKVRAFSLDNYVTLFTTPELLSMIGGTVLLAFGVAILSVILGSLGAVGAYYSKKKTRRAIELANEIPVVNADVVTGFSVCVLLIGYLIFLRIHIFLL